jgi:NADH-quinone oxidoreductase subunit J
MPLPIFWLFALIMLFGAAAVVLLRNPVASAMSMVASFVGLAGLFVGLNAYFAGIIQILVYAGAIMVLFIFIIMLLDLNTDKKKAPKMAPILGGLGIVIAFTIQLIGVISTTPDKGLPALDLADKVIGKLDESPTPSELVTESTTEDDLGDLLVAIVSAARANGLDAERALRTAVRRVIADAER